jgi:SAM-dependent methyltransferase
VSEGNGERKKVICLGCPSYGELTSGAAIGLFRPSRRPQYDVQIACHQSSLLASNMNALWCWALNTAHRGHCDYFAMIHADVEPGEFWLDTLIDELEKNSLDVLSAVVPIKDQRGVTSTALARDDGDTFRVHCRLTMKEVWALPRTFTSEDVGRDVLVNTGCWVCRFDESWAKKVHFTINDRVCFDPKRELYFAQVEPEDWFISRLFHELGLKVGATRALELEHRGTMAFTNRVPWGEHDYDREYVGQSPLDGRPPADWFPHDVAGWLSEDEGRELARLAASKVVLEVGSYCGKSTVCLAQSAVSVAAVDTFDGRATTSPGATLAQFKRQMLRHGVSGRVAPMVGCSQDLLPNLPPVYDLAFIDGDHDAQAVRRDAALAAAVLRPGGVLVFHDFHRPEDQGVTEAVEELLAAGGEEVSRCGSLIVVRPPALVTQGV